jgi:hypothetical protein
VENHRRIYSVLKGKRWVTSGLASHPVGELDQRVLSDTSELAAGPRRLTDRERGAFLADLKSSLSESATLEDEARVVADAAVLDYPNSPECTPSERDRIRELTEKLSISTSPLTNTSAYRKLRLFDMDILLDQGFHLVEVRPSVTSHGARPGEPRVNSGDARPGPESQPP